LPQSRISLRRLSDFITIIKSIHSGFALTLFLEEGMIHVGVVLLNHLEHLLLAGFHDMAAYHKLLQYEVGLVEVEYQV
jgi:hypothetical protein